MKSIKGLYKVEQQKKPDWREKYKKTDHPGWIKRKTTRQVEEQPGLPEQTP